MRANLSKKLLLADISIYPGMPTFIYGLHYLIRAAWSGSKAKLLVRGDAVTFFLFGGSGKSNIHGV